MGAYVETKLIVIVLSLHGRVQEKNCILTDFLSGYGEQTEPNLIFVARFCHELWRHL